MLLEHTNTGSFNTAFVVATAVIFCLIINSIPSFPVFSYVYLTLLIALIVFADIMLRKGSIPMDGKEIWCFSSVVFGFLVAKMYRAEFLDFDFFAESLKYFIFYFIIIYVFRSEKNIRCFLTVFVAISFIVVIFVRIDAEGRLLSWLYAHGAVDGIQASSHAVTTKSGIYMRMTFLNVDPNVYAGKLVLSLLVAYYLFRSTSQQLLKYAIYAPFLILCFLGLLATGSRGGYLQLLFGGTAMYLAYGRVNASRLIKPMVVFSALITLLLLLSTYVPAISIAIERIFNVIAPVISLVSERSDVIGRETHFVQEPSITIRIYGSVEVLKGYLAAGPVCWLVGLGDGISDFTPFFKNYSGYLYWLVRFGLISFVPLVVLIGYLIRKLLMSRKEYLYYKADSTNFELTILCIGILVAFLTKLLGDPAGPHFWLFLGIISATTRLRQ